MAPAQGHLFQPMLQERRQTIKLPAPLRHWGSPGVPEAPGASENASCPLAAMLPQPGVTEHRANT